jgi:glucokinase
MGDALGLPFRGRGSWAILPCNRFHDASASQACVTQCPLALPAVHVLPVPPHAPSSVRLFRNDAYVDGWRRSSRAGTPPAQVRAIMRRPREVALPRQYRIDQANAADPFRKPHRIEQDVCRMSNADRVLLADIGGTNARFALADTSASVPLLDDSVREFVVADFPSLADAAQHYLDETGATAQNGVFAVAGRVDGDEARITNHPWVISVNRTRQALGFQGLKLVNDFAAQAMAVSLLTPRDVVAIGGVQWTPAPLSVPRTYAVIGPGTGLGVAALVIRDGRAYPLETEGGHVSFPPGTPEEIRILDILSAQFGRVSNERLICGPGLVNLYRALSEIAGEDPGGPIEPKDVTARAAAGDPRCVRTLDVFCAVFGAIAGDLVLTTGAWDGVFLTGGLVPKLLTSLQHSGFRQRFEHKGRFSPAMGRVPTLANIHPRPGLLGAAAYAVELFGPKNPSHA